ncbi:hypothetical protein [Pedobacter paludis]|uniref:Uncharacterized protein n=1 Tax=Pedobacter paludis TaxID=2203212 RepID=A0A317EZH6_9SPHI|nr:hypothetical protein [Pedobacter paludis]PWS32264.1 hypothetical protein DF947_10880 [Pedobacter paludis]
MIRSFIFKGYFWGTVSDVEISLAHGAGSDHFHIMVDRYYHGCVFRRNGKLVAFLSETTAYSNDDEREIIQIIEENFYGQHFV